MIEIPLSKQGKNKGLRIAIISDDDEILSKKHWRFSANKYAASKDAYLHRAVMERILCRKLLKSEKVDHINGNGLDNRRENLRLATHAQNLHNRGANKNNPTGLKGAYYVAQINRYRSQIMVNRKKCVFRVF